MYYYQVPFLEREYYALRTVVYKHSVDVKGCDTPGRFATGCGGNFHGASLIF